MLQGGGIRREPEGGGVGKVRRDGRVQRGCGCFLGSQRAEHEQLRHRAHHPAPPALVGRVPHPRADAADRSGMHQDSAVSQLLSDTRRVCQRQQCHLRQHPLPRRGREGRRVALDGEQARQPLCRGWVRQGREEVDDAGGRAIFQGRRALFECRVEQLRQERSRQIRNLHGGVEAVGRASAQPPRGSCSRVLRLSSCAGRVNEEMQRRRAPPGSKLPHGGHAFEVEHLPPHLPRPGGVGLLHHQGSCCRLRSRRRSHHNLGAPRREG
mmetsp:Transcript_12946/g.31490  ORF Transcript_12946/g.31490 Transcript_12946/m.31490 type:complete len:267 (-) Transcript_12946:403-1203(-)